MNRQTEADVYVDREIARVFPANARVGDVPTAGNVFLENWRQLMKSLWTLLIGVGAVMSVGMPADAAELKVGDKAPEFEMKGSDGKTYKLSQFKDKKAVVVAWYPKAFTGG